MRRIPLFAVALVLAAVVALVAFRLGSTGQRVKPAIDGTAQQVTPARGKQSLASPGPHSVHVDPWQPAARDFAGAFLDRSSRRENHLQGLASPRLAALLAHTDPAKLPTAPPIGEPVTVSRTSDSVTAVQMLSDGSAFAFDLVPDPGRATGWIVMSVRPGEQ